MKKPLKTYFDSTKEAPLLLNSSDIRNLVEPGKPGPLKNSNSSSKWSFKRMNIIHISVFSTLVISAFLFHEAGIFHPKGPGNASPIQNSLLRRDLTIDARTKGQKEISIINNEPVAKSSSIAKQQNNPITQDQPAALPLKAESSGQLQAHGTGQIQADETGKLQADETSKLQADVRSQLKPDSISQLSADVTGIKILDLSKEEFLKLGVQVEDKKVVFFKKSLIDVKELSWFQKLALWFYGINTNEPEYVAKVIVFMNGVSNGIDDKDEHKQIGLAPVAPRVSSNYHNGKLMAWTWQGADSVFSQMIEENARNLNAARSVNAMIPIRTTLKDPQGTYFKETDVILWYEVTPELVALLPDRFKKPLSEEIAAVEDPQKPITSGEKFFDTWRANAGAIGNTAIYPNPVRDSHATLNFLLNEERLITIGLHDIFGKKIAELKTAQLTAAGKYKWDLGLQDIASGMYLISVQTDRGEQAVQRIIVD
ncbi:MAG TPA: T9SS type A sorting domain-containing protein [Patescibacteria group bacterium]|nr:T9SS type A sorting domain-containing protein [Patescibacteria group bacterium]